MQCDVKQLQVERGDKILLQGLSFSIKKGECWQLIGENGVGKTSLLRLLAGLAEPLSSECQVKNYLYLGHKQALKASLTVLEWLRFHPYLQASQKHMDIALQQFQLAAIKDHLIQTLSQGQKQRLHLMPLLCVEKTLWLLDEPFAGLDRDGVALLESIIDKKIAQGGAVLLTSHQRMNLQCSVQELLLTNYRVNEVLICD